MTGDVNRPILGWVWRLYLRRHWKLVVVALILMAIEGTTFGALSYLMQPMFDTLFIEGDEAAQ